MGDVLRAPDERNTMNWSNLWSKIKHAVVPAAGAAVAVATGLLGSGVSAAVVAKAAIGAFVAYLVKPARPEPVLDDSAVK